MTTAPYDPRSGNTPDAKPYVYDPRSGNTPDALPGNPGGYYPSGTPFDPMSGNTPDYEYPTEATGTPPAKPTFLYNYTDPDTGDIIDVYDNDGVRTETVVKKGRIKADAKIAADALAAERLAGRTSAYDILRAKFKEFGLESLVTDAEAAILNSDSDAERTLALRNSKGYQTRFAANAKRIANGFAAIDEGTYLDLEDAYQSIAQNYGMPEKYYKKGALGVQQYFEEAIAKNIDPVTFKERIVEGQKVLNANKAVLDAAKQFYPTLTDGDFLEYVLNPKNALVDIKNKVAAAEIGGAALQSGLSADLARAEELQKMGIDKAEATEGYSAIGAGLQRGSELASIYGESPYTQATAESEIFKLSGAQEARKQRQKVTGLEKATFGGKSGLTGGALTRDRAGGI
jgi:hypothetical protein